VHRGDLESLAAGLALDLIVDANEVVAQLGELRPIALVGARGQAVLLRPPHPTHGILVGPSTPWAAQSLAAVFGSVGEERAFVESHALILLAGLRN
jgi:hypothetical protein